MMQLGRREPFSGHLKPAQATGNSRPAETDHGHCVRGVMCIWDVHSAAGATVIDDLNGGI